MAFDERKAQRVLNFIECLRHTKGEFHGKPFLLLPWQRQIVSDVFGTVRDEALDMRQYNQVYIEIGKKNGKQLAVSTWIPTLEGWKTMGELRVGDRVFDERGEPCRVLAFSEIDTAEQCYRITFRDGSMIEAGARHLWDVQVINNGFREKLWTTEEIYLRTMAYRNRHEGTADALCSIVRIPVAKPLVLPERELPLDPYVFGYWLGNGNAVKCELTVRTCDVAVLEANIPYEITSKWHQQGDGSVILRIPALKPLLVGSFREKVIRPEYLRASVSQRWALLQGLMDSDGCISTIKAQSIYVSTIRPLAESIRELLWSLGMKNTMTEQPSTRCGKATGETLYIIRFTTFEDQPTSRLKRKYDRRRERVKETRSCFHYIRDIQPLPHKVEMRCIQVDSPSRLYLAGRSMVPTHNSELGAALALNMLVNDDEWKAEV